MKKNASSKKKVLKSVFKLIEKIGWTNFELKNLHQEKSLENIRIEKFFKNKSQIIIDFSSMIDEEVIKSIDFSELSDTDVKDNLFEFMMTRFEKLNPYKKSLKIILNDLKFDPKSLKELSKKIFNSMDFYMEASNAKNLIFFDFVKSNVFFLIYSYVFQIWLKDNSKDMTKTMQETDKLLTIAEKYSKKFNSFF